jgi:hypothetical protein
VLLASLRSFQNGPIREHKEQCYARGEQLNESLKVLLEGLERGLVSTLTTIGSIRVRKKGVNNGSGPA